MRRTIRRLFTAMPIIGPVHPDALFHGQSMSYVGPGWQASVKQLPMEGFYTIGTPTLANANDRQGVLHDPEDPRHPVAVKMGSFINSSDGCLLDVLGEKYSSIPKSSRLLQVLYESYLEPISMNRVCAHLNYYESVPNNLHTIAHLNLSYLGQTAALIGKVMVSYNCCIMEGATLRADQNEIQLFTGVQILENTCIMTDCTDDLVAYTRNDRINPYQQWDHNTGMCIIDQYTMVEENCYLDSCRIGAYNRIGHGSKIMKGVTTDDYVHILPGSVVTANTHIPAHEIWGGAPAVRVGEINLFEHKKSFEMCDNHRKTMMLTRKHLSEEGDQIIHWMNLMGKLETLMIKYDANITPAVRAKILDFEEGREPFHHFLARVTQIWTLGNRMDTRIKACYAPVPTVRTFAEHDKDSSDSDLHGTYMNLTNIINDYRW